MGTTTCITSKPPGLIALGALSPRDVFIHSGFACMVVKDHERTEDEPSLVRAVWLCSGVIDSLVSSTLVYPANAEIIVTHDYEKKKSDRYPPEDYHDCEDCNGTGKIKTWHGK